MSMRITSIFTNRWTVFWATTYTVEFGMFDEFWLPRLGEPPVNATILVDFDRLAEAWSSIEGHDAWRVKRVNRDYLVRGVRIGRGSFHPKTYFFGGQRDGVLLVGSGNFGLAGLEQGCETFCSFDSREESDRPAIAGWRDWMTSLVNSLDDHELRIYLRLANRW
jgi:hypothetical protein